MLLVVSLSKKTYVLKPNTRIAGLLGPDVVLIIMLLTYVENNTEVINRNENL